MSSCITPQLSEQQKIIKQLRSPLRLNQNATFPRDVLTSECASWAVSVCEEFLDAFVTQSGVNAGFITSR